MRNDVSQICKLAVLVCLAALPARAQWVVCDGTTSQTCTNANVGVKTTNATAPLTVNGVISSTGQLNVTLPGTGNLMWLSSNGGGSVAFTASSTVLNRYVDFYVRDGGGTPRIYLPSYVGNAYFMNVGNVGIGTTSPAAKLDIAGSINGTGLTINGMQSTNTRFQQASDAIQSSLFVTASDTRQTGVT